MSLAVLDQHAKMKLSPSETVGDNHVGEDAMLSLPVPVQDSLDRVLDYYTENMRSPDIKLCGTPLEVASEFVARLRGTVPEHLNHDVKDILDFMIREMASFCKTRNMNKLTMRFVFNRAYTQGEV